MVPFGPLRLTPVAALLGWLVLVPVNVVASLARAGVGTGGAKAFALAQLVGAGHFLAVGLISALVVWAWARVPARAAWMSWAALAVVAAVVGWLAVGPDFEGFVGRVAAMNAVPAGLLGAIACVVVVTGTALLSTFVTRFVWLAGLVIGVALTVVNNLVLELDYPGIHLVLGWAGVVAATVSFARRALGWAPPRRAAVVMAVLAPVAIASLVLRPSEAAWRRLLETSGAFPGPFVSELTPELTSALGSGDDPWLKSRASRPPTRPSRLSRLPDDAIVMLIMLDALRADVVRRGEPQVPMPNFERLRARSVEFTMARSAAPSTLSSMTSTFTGKYYSQLHGKKKSRDEDVSEDESPRVAEMLKEAGVAAFHIAPTRLLEAKKGATRGFEVVNVGEKKPSAAVLPELEKKLRAGVDGRLLVYMHWMDAHSPYDLAGTEGTARDAYLREVKIVDDRLGELMAMLDATGVAGRTTLIISADHGEAFGEHDTWEHGKTVYEELLRVPMLIVTPGLAPRTVDTPVSTIDLGATILDLFDRPVPGYFMGQSLLPIAHGKKDRVDHPIAAEGGRRLRAFYATDDIKVIFDRTRKTTEVYDLAADPGETKNLADDPAYAKHVERGRRFFAAHQDADEK